MSSLVEISISSVVVWPFVVCRETMVLARFKLSDIFFDGFKWIEFEFFCAEFLPRIGRILFGVEI